jgi:hypothetical protein
LGWEPADAPSGPRPDYAPSGQDAVAKDHVQLGDQADGEPSGLHQASPAVANQLNDFVRSRQPARLLLGIDFLLFDEDV